MTIYDLLNHTKKEVAAILTNKENYYLSYSLKKRNGKPRWIDAPQEPLRSIQKSLMCNILYKFRAHRCATGFISGKSVKSGAEEHFGNKVLLCMDLSNFFSSIKLNRVFSLSHFLLKRLDERIEEFKYSQADEDVLSQLVTFKKQLPQGAPTSPAMANLVAMNLDKDLAELCDKSNLTYTRYADDLAFSHADVKYDIYAMLPAIIEIITTNGFIINRKKTRVMKPHKRMSVTGIVINDKLGVPKWKWRNFRARLHNLVQDGNPIDQLEYQELRGYSEWVKTLNHKRGMKFLTELGKLTWTKSSN